MKTIQSYKINYLMDVAVALCACFAMMSCDDSIEGGMRTHLVDVEVVLPDGVEPYMVTSPLYTFTNLSSGMVQEFRDTGRIELLAGIYDVSLEAEVCLHDGLKSQLRASRRSMQVTADHTLVRMEAYSNLPADDLIIIEVFFAGTLQSSGNNYIGDDYIKLYNNTDHVIYADGLTLFESKFLTTQKLDFRPDLMDTDVTVDALYTIPGNGYEHPVEPGGVLLIADTGIDHRTINPNSFDLGHADWEWYDESSRPSVSDIDSPTVGNLEKWYCYTQTVWSLHNRGYKAYGIARIPVAKEEYLKNYYYSYDYELVTAAGSFAMSASAYRLPNEWICDVVNCSVAASYQWTVTAPSLDCGWTGCGAIADDKTRYFHSVRRKFLYVDETGRPVFLDTNDSSNDFNRDCIPSEIEMQHTSIDMNGTTASVVTYDGVVPISSVSNE